MRKKFRQELALDGLAIGNVKLDLKSRHELPPLLAAMQYIFGTREVNEQVFSLLEEKILKDKGATGGLGMGLWEILVLGSVRLLCRVDMKCRRRGKPNREVVIGHNVLVATDQYGFIVDHHVADHEADSSLAIPLGIRLSERFSAGYVLGSLSFDRGFYSFLAKENLGKKFENVIMPKPGKKNNAEEIEESGADYVAKRKKHSAVESNINELEHNGVDRVPDKTLDGFKRYTAPGVLAYNLKRLGKILIAQKTAPRKIKRRSAAKRVA